MKKRIYYMGNNPNSYDYDPSLPIGWNKWDAQEVEEPEEDDSYDEPEINEDKEQED